MQSQGLLSRMPMGSKARWALYGMAWLCMTYRIVHVTEDIEGCLGGVGDVFS